ncbi:Stp1/IreP family PP2C-type Ser/Thr phosphatase [Myxococcota bacterium]|nr:Stp1/IreP family PP2C-type Ser/Thr phosphatase [Myxococcota bacterium]MBU1432223.1 Stp1/IreP family PP2C-type Ser/Thr phosphatase [Myxococcota bacterium]MBU1896687.1 Stp1/IreP family PP2C-type Ser/Thr phosphatase [Myxococcota bacterium]
MKLTSAGHTHVGMKRLHNEDSLKIFREENLFVVADGMGGHASGEVASQMSVETIGDFFRSTAEDGEITWPFKMEKGRHYEENRLITGIKLSNRQIHSSSTRDSKLKGMGTTIVAVFFMNDTAYVGHVGDSRVYRFRKGVLTQITEDHSLLNDYIKMRQLTPEEIENFPHKNVIVRALGMKETVQVDVMMEKPQDGDIYLLCSDGLSGMLTDPEMEAILNKESDLDAACKLLIDGANHNGGTDNITVILVRYEKDD